MLHSTANRSTALAGKLVPRLPRPRAAREAGRDRARARVSGAIHICGIPGCGASHDDGWRACEEGQTTDGE